MNEGILMGENDNDNAIMTDDLNQRIGVLTRREVEARILAPVIEAMAEAFGRDAVHEILRKTIETLAREQGAALAAEYGDDGAAFLETLQFWTRDDALEIEILHQDDKRLDFDVTRCRYAESYRALGIAELGKTLSCARDGAFIEGFNPKARLTRDQTILGGAPCCTFRYDFDAKDE